MVQRNPWIITFKYNQNDSSVTLWMLINWHYTPTYLYLLRILALEYTIKFCEPWRCTFSQPHAKPKLPNSKVPNTSQTLQTVDKIKWTSQVEYVCVCTSACTFCREGLLIKISCELVFDKFIIRFWKDSFTTINNKGNRQIKSNIYSSKTTLILKRNMWKWDDESSNLFNRQCPWLQELAPF